MRPNSVMRKIGKIGRLLVAFSVSGIAQIQASEIQLITPIDGATVRLLRPLQRSWMSMPREERVRHVADIKGFREKMGNLAEGGGDIPLPVCLKWRCHHAEGESCGGVYTVEVAKRRDGARHLLAENVRTNALELWNLEVGTEYTWSVTCGKGICGGRFITEDMAPRWLRWEGIGNVRDHGGWKTKDGYHVRQGLAFRSKGLNGNALTQLTEKETLDLHRAGQLEALFGEKGRELAALIDAGKVKPGDSCLKKTFRREKCTKGPLRGTPESREWIRTFFGIRTDLDLRQTDTECWGMNGSPLGPSVEWANIPSTCYGAMGREAGIAAFKRCFDLFLDPSKYGIVYHCIGGADRTGSLAFILNALLGVQEEDLWRDWELTCFGRQRAGFTHEECFDKLVKVFDRYPGKSINERVEAYVRSMGYDDADLKRLRDIFIDKGGPAVDLRGLPVWRDIPGVCNLRDIGGWTGLNGRLVKKGLLYRSGHFDNVTSTACASIVNGMGVRTEIDLRSDAERKWKGEKGPLGVRRLKCEVVQYAAFGSENGMRCFAAVFRTLLNEVRYPAVLHGDLGADRTGSLVMLLNGLLGVSEGDLLYDWRVSHYAVADPLFKQHDRFDRLKEMIDGFPGATFADRVVAYAHSAGITDAEIARWRKLMLVSDSSNAATNLPLKVGIISDPHLRIGSDGRHLDACFQGFRNRKTEVIIVSGDLVNDGTIPEYELFRQHWLKTFGDMPGVGGAPELFIVMGNHDSRAGKGKRSKKLIQDLSDNRDEVWRLLTGRPFPGEIYAQKVRGIQFVGCQWGHEGEIGSWLRANGDLVDTSKLFVLVQHPHPSGTVFLGVETEAKDSVRQLSKYSNCLVISGHSHTTFADDTAIWQGSFTSMAAGTAGGGAPRHGRGTPDYRNGYFKRREAKPPYPHMDTCSTGATWQGAIMTIWRDKIKVERLDFRHDKPVGDDWILPLPLETHQDEPFVFAAMAKAPVFDKEAKIRVERVDGKNAMGEMERQIVVTAPQARPVSKWGRTVVNEFELFDQATGKSLIKALALQPGYGAPLEEGLKSCATCVFGQDELPPNVQLGVRITPMNAIGKRGESLTNE